MLCTVVVTLPACSGQIASLTLERFRQDVEHHRIEAIRVKCTEIVGTYRTKAQAFRTERRAAFNDMIPTLRDNGVGMYVRNCGASEWTRPR